jgi:hypothetical protein
MGNFLGSYLTCLYSRGEDQMKAVEMGGAHRAHYAENKLMKIILTKREDKTQLAIKT